MKKNLIVCLLVLVLIISGCGRVKDKEEDKKVDNTQDALKFKEEYESLNGQISTTDKAYRTIEIDKDNPFVYTDCESLVKLINDGESFVVYF